MGVNLIILFLNYSLIILLYNNGFKAGQQGRGKAL